MIVILRILLAVLIAANTLNSVPIPEALAIESEWIPFEATAYTARCAGCTGITRTGYDVRRTIYAESGRRIIATDPREIALGTEFDVRLADGAVINAVAGDTGGAIKGRKLDVLHRTYAEAIEFGRQSVEVRIISKELREKTE